MGDESEADYEIYLRSLNMFTIDEYVAKHGLDVDPSDLKVRKQIIRHLLDRGYRKIKVVRKGKYLYMWVSTDAEKTLADKLSGIKE